MTSSSTLPSDANAAVEGTRDVDVLVIGSGFSGLGAAIKLAQEGTHSFLVLERGAGVGGTWRDNSYPGAACDVPSHLYSYSFALNPNWSRSFSRQPEIHSYLETVAKDNNVLDKHIFNCHVESATWDTATERWVVETSQGRFTGKFAVSAVGALCEPSLPNIKGIEDFQGEVFHSAQWNHDADLTGKRVAVIGTGASAIQIVPQVAKIAGQLDVYQRTAPWVLPRMDRPYTLPERLAFKHIPGFQRLARTGIYLARETQVMGLAKQPILMKGLQVLAENHLRLQIRDKELRKKVTPNWRIGCKRMLISNNYFPALARPNVDVVTDGIAEVTANAIVTKDGTSREVDAIVVATGFHVTDSPVFQTIYGKDGRSLAETFADNGMQGYKGSTIAGFPNLFFLVGPNTGLGHTSIVFMIESQLNYLVDMLRTVKSQGIKTVEVRKDAQDAFNTKLQAQLQPTVWMTGGCASWYLDKHGNNTTLWPDFTFTFRNLLKRFDVEAYELSHSGTANAAPTANGGDTVAADPRELVLSTTESTAK